MRIINNHICSYLKLAFIALFILFFIGCGFLGSEDSSKNSVAVAWLNNGELSYGGPVPGVAVTGQRLEVSSKTEPAEADYKDFAYGFSPSAASGSRSLVLNTARKMARLLQSGKEIASAKLLDTSGLIVGSYQIAHKQRNPLWYAPKEYFSSRGINVPAEGDKQRYLRGAFGDFALFVSPTEAIHSGPFSLSELNGARIEEQDFAKIFYMVEIGDNIKVE